MNSKRWIMIGTAIVLTASLAWLIVSLRDDDSTLNAAGRYLKDTVCWSPRSSFACAIKAMAKYQKKGRYDEAISVGVKWADEYPDSFTSRWIYQDVSTLYIRKSTIERGRSEEYLKQAVVYRDKAISSALDSPYALQPLVAISESIGDLSATQRCVQYSNSIKLLDRMNLLANENKDRLARQFKPDLAERNKVECLLEWINSTQKRLRSKFSASTCG